MKKLVKVALIVLLACWIARNPTHAAESTRLATGHAWVTLGHAADSLGSFVDGLARR
jgi:hypothetical protein